MKLFIWPLILTLALAPQAWAAEAEALTATAEASLAATPAPEATPQALAQPRLRLGVAWPELRARMNVAGPWDAEIKGAFDPGAQVYAARLYYSPSFTMGPVGLEFGAEGGWVRLAGLEDSSGQGMLWQATAGAHWPFSPRWGLTLEFGPAWISIWEHTQGTQSLAWLYNGALYFTLF